MTQPLNISKYIWISISIVKSVDLFPGIKCTIVKMFASETKKLKFIFIYVINILIAALKITVVSNDI